MYALWLVRTAWFLRGATRPLRVCLNASRTRVTVLWMLPVSTVILALAVEKPIETPEWVDLLCRCDLLVWQHFYACWQRLNAHRRVHRVCTIIRTAADN